MSILKEKRTLNPTNVQLNSNCPLGFRQHGVSASVLAKQKREQLNKTIDVESLNLSPQERQIFEFNIHLRQVFLTNRKFITREGFSEKDRLVSLDTSPRATYVRRTSEAKTVAHSGQRKLLNMEIEFLTQYAVRDCVVIYAGAAPGHHHKVLEVLFPFVIFILYDPRGFPIESTPRREINQVMFSHVTAQQLSIKYKNKTCLFISDIRRYDEDLSAEDKEKLVKEDMEQQLIWVSILNPLASLLKFRAPFDGSSINYFKGKIMLQPWTGATSSETRLLVTNIHDRADYDGKIYEDILFYFNTITRTSYYKDNTNEKCHCYDCSTERFIINRYFEKYSLVSQEEVEFLIKESSLL
jgi:hypothetical protein